MRRGYVKSLLYANYSLASQQTAQRARGKE
jgi:hypothetical protein